MHSWHSGIIVSVEGYDRDQHVPGRQGDFSICSNTSTTHTTSKIISKTNGNWVV
jgi:hypothetical protein